MRKQGTTCIEIDIEIEIISRLKKVKMLTTIDGQGLRLLNGTVHSTGEMQGLSIDIGLKMMRILLRIQDSE